MPVAIYQQPIVNGRAMRYRIRFVKLKRRKRLPTKPMIRDPTFNQ